MTGKTKTETPTNEYNELELRLIAEAKEGNSFWSEFPNLARTGLRFFSREERQQFIAWKTPFLLEDIRYDADSQFGNTTKPQWVLTCNVNDDIGLIGFSDNDQRTNKFGTMRTWLQRNPARGIPVKMIAIESKTPGYQPYIDIVPADYDDSVPF